MQLVNKILSIFNNKTRLPYEALGEEEGIRNLVEDFYSIMNNDPKAVNCKNTHPLDNEGMIPKEIQEKLFFFLSGFSGGPQLFMQKIGPPKMRMRHGHVKIGTKEREEWLYCMRKALKKKKLSRKEYNLIFNSFIALAHRIQNSE
jgi:hemoglobin